MSDERYQNMKQAKKELRQAQRQLNTEMRTKNNEEIMAASPKRPTAFL